MKKLYAKPSIELVVFNYADVMAASGDPISTWLIDNDDSPTETISSGTVWIDPVSSVPDTDTSDIGGITD